MSVPFGPQLIGQTEKVLNAVLTEILDGRLTEPQWVTLRLAQVLRPRATTDEALARAVADRARFADAGELVRDLGAAGLVRDGRLTRKGEELVAEVQARIAERTTPVWADLDADDVAAASRVLNLVLARARAVLA